MFLLTFELSSVDRGSLSEKKLLFSKGQSEDGHLTVFFTSHKALFTSTLPFNAYFAPGMSCNLHDEAA